MSDVESTFLKPTVIFLGSGAGGLIRYWLGGIVQSSWGQGFPMGTLAINVSGCLIMGFFAIAWADSAFIREEYRALVLVGVLGGYTTFSTFGRDTLELARVGQWGWASCYVVGSVALSLSAVWLGALMANKLLFRSG